VRVDLWKDHLPTGVLRPSRSSPHPRRVAPADTSRYWETLNGPREQAGTIRRYVAWWNRHATDHVRKIVERAEILKGARVAWGQGMFCSDLSSRSVISSTVPTAFTLIRRLR